MKSLGRVKKIAGLLLMVLLISGAFVVSGCGQKSYSNAPDNGLKGSLTVAGSTSVQPFSEVLAEAFMAKNKGVQVNVQGGGSSVGIEAALSGIASIGASSRELKAEENAQGLVATIIALDGIAVVTHPSNTVSGLNSDQVMNIYLGNIKNWKEVGGPDAPITVVTREEGSGTREAFTALVMNKKDISKTAIVQNSTGAVRTTVAGDKNAVGYVSLSSLDKTVKALAINGSEASESNVKNGFYKLQRPFLYVTKGEPEGIAKKFIEFVMSSEGQKLIMEEGAISINK